MTPIILLPTTTLSLSPSRHLFTHHHSTAPSNFSLESTENFITKSRPSGSKTRFPPVVRREMPAFSTSADEGRAAARRGGAGDGSSCPRAEPRRREDGTRPDLSWRGFLFFAQSTICTLCPSCVRPENGISTPLRGFLRQRLPYLILPLFYLILPLFLPYFTASELECQLKIRR